ncbi:hypothetical protein Tco_0339789 [Tanacetum coccineum]
MDPNISIRRICLAEDNRISLNDGVESNGEWDTHEYYDTTDSGQKKEAKAFTFYRMETEEISERYIAPCFVDGLEAYDGEINLENDKNMISNEFAGMLCLEHKVKNKDKVVNKELIVSLRGEIYFIKFIINLEEDDIEPGVVLGRSFLRRKDFGDIPEIEGIDVPPYVCKMGKSSRNKKKPDGNYKMTHSDEGPSLTVRRPLIQEGMDHEALKKDIYERVLILQDPRPIIETMKFIDQHKKLLDSVMLDKIKLDREVKADEEEATKSFLYTCGGIINTIKGTTSTFDGICHQDFYIAAVKSKEEEKDSEDGEEYYTVGTHDDEAGSSQLKRSRQHETVEEAMLPHVYHEFLLWGLSNRAAKSRYNANLARLLPKQIYSSVIMDWGVLNNMGCAKEIEAMLEIKVYEFDEVVMDDELMTKKLIKFRLAGRGGLRSNENFNAKDYWLSISSEEELHLSRSLASTIRSPILRVLQKMITYGLGQRTSGYDKMQRNEFWLMSMFEAKHQNGYANAA